MKSIKNILIAFLGILAIFVTGCRQEVPSQSKVIIVSTDRITFAAEDPEAQVFTVYADAEWSITSEVPSWLHVTPSNGFGTVEVTVYADDNMRDGAPSNVRIHYLKIEGRASAGVKTVKVYQEGDKFRDVQPKSVKEVLEQDDETVALLNDVAVMAHSEAGIIVSDGSDAIYAANPNSIKVPVGSKVYVGGFKMTQRDRSYIDATDSDDTLKVLTTAEAIKYPEPKVVENINEYASDVYEYVKILAGLTVEGTLKIGSFDAENQFVTDSTATVTLKPSAVGDELKAFKGRVIEATGYMVGKDKNGWEIMIVSAEDKGVFGKLPLYYESWQGQSANSQKVADWSLTNMIGTGVTGVTYAAGSSCDIRQTYLQGSSTGYKTYENELFPGYDAYSQGHSAAHLYAGTGTYNAAESWVEIRNIKLSGQKALKWGMAIFGVNGWAEETPSELPYPVYYKFDNENDWTLLQNVSFIGNWHWYTLPAFAVPEGATDVSFRFEPQTSNYARIDDCTLVGAELSEVSDTPSSYLKVVGPSTVELSAEAQDIVLQFKSNVKYTHNLADYSEWITPKGITTDGDVSSVTLAIAANAGTDREAVLMVRNTEEGLSATVTLKQAGSATKTLEIEGADAFSLTNTGGEFTVNIKCNTEFAPVIDADWVTVKGVTKEGDVTTATVAVAPNKTSKVRRTVVKIENADKSLSALVYVAQDLTLPTGDNVIFADDFSWLKPHNEAYNATVADAKKVSDCVGLRTTSSDGCPNIHSLAASSTAGMASLKEEFTSRGYVDLNPGKKVMYSQDCYLKFGKSNTGTALQIPALASLEGPTDVTLSFNYCTVIQGSGTVDPLELFVAVDENPVNTVAFPVEQKGGDSAADPTVMRDMFWQTATIDLTGITKDSKIAITPSNFTTTQRYFIDNIIIVKAGTAAPDPEVIQWAFSANRMTSDGYAATFGTAAGTPDKTAGNGGQYVNANLSGKGKIEYYQVDKTEIDTNSKAARCTGSTGQPYITGGWPGDYWLFTLDCNGKTFPAGTKVSMNFKSRPSPTGMRYWILEYKDGDEWKPVFEMKTETETGTNAQYNYMYESSSDQVIDEVITLTKPFTEVLIRLTTAANCQANNKGALAAPNGGTHRISGAEEDSPKFVIGYVE